MAKLLIKNAHVVSPGYDQEGASVLVEDNKIAEVLAPGAAAPAADSTFDADGALVVPGFIDIHFHGANGYDFTDTETPDCVEQIAKAKLQEGVTSIEPTTLTLGHDTLVATARKVKAYRKAGEKYCKVIGIHLEGPFINPNCLGAQNPAFVRKPDIAEVLEIDKISHVSEVTFAAEMEGGVEFAAQCLANGIIPSCGHSAATFAQLKAAYDKGLRHLTHFCNQMTKLHHREVGMVGGGLLLDDLNLEMICDTIHLCPDMIRLAFKVHPLEHIEAITDSLRCSHLPDGPSNLGGLEVIVKNGQARLVKDGNLAGSTLWMNIALKNIHEVTGLPLKDVIRCTSWNQATELGLGRRLGRVRKGYRADLAVLDPKTFAVKAVFVEGQKRI